MADNYVSTRNIKFLIHEVFKASELNKFKYYEDYDKDSIDMAIDAAKQIGDQFLFPFYSIMDKKKAYCENEVVHVHESLRPAINAIAEGGWIAAHQSYDDGGQQMPLTVMNAGLFIFYAANSNSAAYAFLTQGAANLIHSFGSNELKENFLAQMYSGKWQGTMALTEPQAGSSLSDITATAIPNGDGTYTMKGQKIYISGGDHTAVDNVVHLMLARLPDAPVGAKGISLFVVPKYKNEGGKLVHNDVTAAGIYGKMGQKGYVAAHLMIGEKEKCEGYLVGEPHRGLSYMFKMMNEARIATGMVASGVASAAYYAALQYANERPQGRHPSKKSADQPQVLIIEHADVKRMLLMQKSIVEGSVSLLLQSSYYADLAEVAEGKEKENAHLLLELLTPIAKSYPSEMGTVAVSTGLQCLGGAGYTDDFPLEQQYRDIRVNSIYEGTTGIHGLDLLGRKIMMKNGLAVQLLSKEIQAIIVQASSIAGLETYAGKLGKHLKMMGEVTTHLIGLAQKDRPEVFLADATLYLDYFSIITISWQWLKQGIVVEQALANSLPETEQQFYESKRAAMQYYFEYELPKTLALHERLLSSNRLTLETKAANIV